MVLLLAVVALALRLRRLTKGFLLISKANVIQGYALLLF